MSHPTDEQKKALRLDLGISDKTQEDLNLTYEEAEYLLNPKGRRKWH